MRGHGMDVEMCKDFCLFSQRQLPNDESHSSVDIFGLVLSPCSGISSCLLLSVSLSSSLPLVFGRSWPYSIMLTPPQCPSQQICWCEHFGCTFIRIQLFDSWKIFFLHSVCKRVPPEDLKEILILVFHILSTTSCDYFKTVLTKHLTPFPSWWKVPNMTSPAMTHQASPIHK